MIIDLRRSIDPKRLFDPVLHLYLDDLVRLTNSLIFQEFEKNKNMTSSSLQSAVIEVSLTRSLV